MKVLAIMLCLLGVIAVLSPETFRSEDSLKDESIALNFVIYRNAVNNFAAHNPAATGSIPDSNLSLPSGWIKVHPWSNRIDNTNCYVWGEVTGYEPEEIMDIFMNSYAIGLKQNGLLVNKHGSGIALPVYIPDGCIVSVIAL